ncbi:MAG: PAS domain S-box protein [Nitrospiraceae bacterium]|nr:MAG: PAS domain S-box protein [Nitrospiraceae bacterium]
MKQAISFANAEKAKSEGIIAAIGDGISIQGRDFRVLYQNEMHKSMIGDHVGAYCFEAYEKRDTVCEGCPVAKAFETGEMYKSTRSVSTDNGTMHVEITASPVKDSDGNIYAGIEAVRDISKRIQSQILIKEQASLAELRASIGLALTKGETLDEMLQQCCDAFINNLGAAFARIWILDNKGDTLELRASSGMCTRTDGKHSRISVGQYKIGFIAREKKPHLSNSLIGDPHIHDQEWVKREGMKAFAGYPLIISDSLIGVIAVFLRKPLSEVAFKSLDSIADEIALGINRKQSEEALITSEEKFRTFFEMSPVGIIINPLISQDSLIFDNKLKNALFNNAFRKFFGYTETELKQKSIPDLSFPDDIPENKLLMAELLQGKSQNYQMEKRYYRKDGSLVWGHINATLLREYGRASHIMTSLIDITARKKMESLILQSKLDWESTFDSIEDMITIHDRDFNILRANKTAQHFLNVSAEVSPRCKCFEYYHGTDTPPENCPSCESMKTTTPSVHEFYEPHLKKYIEVSAIPRFDSDNGFSGLIHIVRDISERKETEAELEKHRNQLEGLVREKTADLSSAINLLKDEIIQRRTAEEALRLSEKKYRDLYDNAPDMYHTLNKEKIIIDCNQTEASMLGYAKEDIIGRPLANFFTKESRAFLDDDHVQLQEKGALFNLERTFIRKDGTTFPAIINVFANYDKHGRMTGTRAIARDITERKLAEAETMRAGHLASLGELAAGVAHEINNPINGIINYAEILSRKSSHGSSEKDVASRIIKEGDRIANIVRSLLSFARDSKEEKNPVNVYRIMSESLALTETQMRKDGIKLKINIPHNLPPIIAQPQQIEQVFLNVLSNARYALNEKYDGEHTDKILEITCSPVSVDNTLYVRTIFQDHGTGIPARIMDKIMNPFFSTKAGNIGTGLGLSISHGIVSDHKGKMLFNSVEGEFTHVCIDLPAQDQTK